MVQELTHKKNVKACKLKKKKKKISAQNTLYRVLSHPRTYPAHVLIHSNAHTHTWTSAHHCQNKGQGWRQLQPHVLTDRLCGSSEWSVQVWSNECVRGGRSERLSKREEEKGRDCKYLVREWETERESDVNTLCKKNFLPAFKPSMKQFHQSPLDTG